MIYEKAGLTLMYVSFAILLNVGKRTLELPLSLYNRHRKTTGTGSEVRSAVSQSRKPIICLTSGREMEGKFRFYKRLLERPNENCKHVEVQWH